MSPKNCIVYVPYEIDTTAARARMIRPRKMVDAFRSIGYEVYLVHGYSKERKKSMNKIKRMIKDGVKFDFLYAESSTEPTLLTDPNHYPTHPFMDYAFFAFLKKQGIKIGLFYCDIYWMFPSYGRGLSKVKKNVALAGYKYDLWEYERYLDQLYVPSMKFGNYLNTRLNCIIKELPPGADKVNVKKKSYDTRDFERDPLTIFYVGGLGSHYKVEKLMIAVSQIPKCKLVLCCRIDEYENGDYKKYSSGNIEVIHKSGKELEPYYSDADICSLMFEESDYRTMAIPVKSYEYIAHEKPIIATKGTLIGNLVKKESLGESIDYTIDSIKMTLEKLINNPHKLDEYQEYVRIFKEENYWGRRAEQVAQDLCK